MGWVRTEVKHIGNISDNIMNNQHTTACKRLKIAFRSFAITQTLDAKNQRAALVRARAKAFGILGRLDDTADRASTHQRLGRCR